MISVYGCRHPTEAKMKKIIATLAGLTASLFTTAASAQLNNPIIASVNCASGSIQSTIESSTLARPLEIVVTGPCTENLDIERDQVTIRSATSGRQTLNGNITVSTADRVFIDGFTVKRVPGPATHGIKAENGATLRLENVVATGHRGTTLVVSRNSFVWANLVTLIGTSISRETIAVTDGGTLRFERSKATASNPGNDAYVMGLYRNGTVRMQYNVRLEHTNNPLSSNQYDGAAIVALDGSVVRIHQDGPINTVTGNVVSSDSSTMDLRHSNITGNVLIHRNSLIELRNSTNLTGNVSSGARSLLDYKGATQTGNADCFNEGALRNVPGTVTPGVGCTVY